jgi:hypothetical protein
MARSMAGKGLAGLVPRYPAQRASRLQAEVVKLVEQARRELLYGALRTRVWLRRRHKRNVSLGAIRRTFERLGLPKLPSRSKRRSRPRQLTLFEKPTPGDSVQIDVNVVKVAGRKVFQYTAVLRLYRRQNQWSSLDFFGEVQRAFPFPIRKVQSDNGIRYRYIKPRHPQQNGKVERSHRTDQKKFWGRHRFDDFDRAVAALTAWEHHYNYDRFSLALHGQTPAEKLARLLHLLRRSPEADDRARNRRLQPHTCGATSERD